MAQLSIFTFPQWNNIQIVGAQAASAVPLDFSVGSNPLALVEGCTASLLYLQADILQLLALTRAATCVGTDLDTFYADFPTFPARLPATLATGVIQLHRDQATTSLAIPADGSAQVLLSDGSQSYKLVADAGQAAYNSGTNTYNAAIGTSNIRATVVALNSGTVGNTPVGSALLLGPNTAGFDTATVVSGFQNGVAAETDAAMRSRFVLFMLSLSRATLLSIESAIANVQTGIDYSIINNSDPAGNFEPGNFLVFVDDGSGNPPDSLLAAVDAAVTAYQGNTISHNVRRPTVVNAVVSFSIVVKGGIDPTQLASAVYATVADYINSLQIGQALSLTRLSAIVYNSTTSVQNVEFVTINGAQADLNVTSTQVIKLATGGLIINTLTA